MKKNLFYIALTLAAIVCSFELDIFVPAIPTIQSFFNISNTDVSRLISINILGLIIGSFIFGPLSDIYGRKKTLLIGLLGFTIFSFLCGISPSYFILLVSRFFQGITASAGIIIVSSMIIDLNTEEESNRRLTFLNSIITASMAGAPIIGNYFLPFWGWNGNFYFISVLSLFSLLLVLIFCPKNTKPPSFIQPSKYYLLVIFKKQIQNREFLIRSSIPSLFYAAMITFITFLPLILVTNLKIPQSQYGFYQGIIMAVFCLSSLLVTYSKKILTIDQFFKIGVLLISTSMIFFLSIGIHIIKMNSSLISMSMMLFMIGFAFTLGKYIIDSIKIYPSEKGLTFSTLGAIKLIITSLCIEFSTQFTRIYQFNIFLAIGIIIFIGLGLHWRIYVSNKG